MVKGGLIAVAAMLSFSACTDDHFDIQAGSVTGVNTIWQNIEATADLDSVAQILRRTKVMKSETDKGKKQTYAEFLNEPQELTVWFPVNGTFDAKHYLDRLDQADALRSTDSLAAMRIDYEVGNQFVRNHVARFNYSSGAQQQVRMLNGKLITYVPGSTFNGVALQPNSIPSSNGMLNLLNGQSQFAYNIYEYMASHDEFSDLYTTLDTVSTYTFSEAWSTEGAMNNNGQMEYIDSVWIRSNVLESNANISNMSNEDSLSIVILPTNSAFAQAKDVVKSLYKYKSSYNYEWSKSARDFTYKGSQALKFNTDSLSAARATVAILSHSLVSVSNVVNDELRLQKDAVLNKAENADSLYAASFSHIYNQTPGQKNPIFDDKTAIDASNGYIYAVENYNYDPAYAFISKFTLKPSSYNIAALTGSSTDNGELITLDEVNYNDTVPLNGLIENNQYYYFPVSGNNQLNLDIPLNNVLSGKYKISIVMLPNRVNKNNIRFSGDQEIIESPIFDASILDDAGSILNSADGQTGKVTRVPIAQTGAQRIVLWESFEFPYCYASLPSGYSSFPRLRISLPYAYQRLGNCKALSIGSIILEPVRE